MFSVSIFSVMAVDQRFIVCGQCFALLMRKTTLHLNGFILGLFLPKSVTNEYEVSSLFFFYFLS